MNISFNPRLNWLLKAFDPHCVPEIHFNRLSMNASLHLETMINCFNLTSVEWLLCRHCCKWWSWWFESWMEQFCNSKLSRTGQEEKISIMLPWCMQTSNVMYGLGVSTYYLKHRIMEERLRQNCLLLICCQRMT